MNSPLVNQHEYTYPPPLQGPMPENISLFDDSQTTLNSTAIDYCHYPYNYPPYEFHYPPPDRCVYTIPFFHNNENYMFVSPTIQEPYCEHSNWNYMNRNYSPSYNQSGVSEASKRLEEYIRAPFDEKARADLGDLFPQLLGSSLNISPISPQPPVISPISTSPHQPTQPNPELQNNSTAPVNQPSNQIPYSQNLTVPYQQRITPNIRCPPASLLNKGYAHSPSHGQHVSKSRNYRSYNFTSEASRNYVRRDHPRNDPIADEKRNKHNRLERERRKEVAEKYTALKAILTAINSEYSRGSKSMTLNRARSEIIRINSLYNGLRSDMLSNHNRRLQLIHDIEQYMIKLSNTCRDITL